MSQMCNMSIYVRICINLDFTYGRNMWDIVVSLIFENFIQCFEYTQPHFALSPLPDSPPVSLPSLHFLSRGISFKSKAEGDGWEQTVMTFTRMPRWNLLLCVPTPKINIIKKRIKRELAGEIHVQSSHLSFSFPLPPSLSFLRQSFFLYPWLAPDS